METTTLTLRRVAIDTYRENVAYLHRDCELYRSEGFQALNKIEAILLRMATQLSLFSTLL